MSFYYNVLLSSNPCVNLCAKLCVSSNTQVATNRRILLAALNDDGSLLHDKSKLAIKSILHKKLSKPDDECTANAMTIKELSLLAETGSLCILNYSEINELLHDICVK